MGINLVLWRARIGLFIYFSGSFKTKDNPRCHKTRLGSWLIYLLCSVLLLILTSLCLLNSFVLHQSLRVLLLFLIVSWIWFSHVVLACLIYAIIRVTLNVYCFRSSPSCLLYIVVMPVAVLLSIPGFANLICCVVDQCTINYVFEVYTVGTVSPFCNVVNPVTSYLLLSAGDIHPNPGPKENINVLFTNVNSLTAESGQRFSELKFRLVEDSIHIAGLCESGGNLDLNQLNIDGYYKLDSTVYKKSGRGLIFYVKNSLTFKRRPDLESDDCMWIQIYNNHMSSLIGLFYRSPSQNAEARNTYFSNFDSIIDKVLSVRTDLVLLGGDFNARSKFWWSDDVDSTEGHILYDIGNKHSLYQLIDQPTRVTANSRSCLDLIFCNSLGHILSTDVTPPISFSDHSVTQLKLDLQCEAVNVPHVKRIWKYSLVNYDILNEAVRLADWHNILYKDSVDEICSSFTETLTSIFESHIPHSDRVFRTKDMPWFTPNIRKAINRRTKLYHKMSNDHSNDNVRLYKDSCKYVRELVIKSKLIFRDNVCNSLNDQSTGSKNYWLILKNLLGKKFSCGIPPLQAAGGIFDTNLDKCALFLDTFVAKFHHEHNLINTPYFPPVTNNLIANVDISEAKVRELLLNLDPGKQGGVDGITNRMLRSVAVSLAPPLSKFFKKCLEEGCFPDLWKVGIVVPIYKGKGAKTSVDQYRPVTLLNSLSKVFEKLIHESIYEHLMNNDLIYDKQSGFLPGHDTQKQLVHIVHSLMRNNESKLTTRGVFLDIAGAFDAVPHHLLSIKLYAYGIRGDLLTLLNNYLCDRRVKVRVDNSYSNLSPPGFINSGVPQGSILGPLLFLIYINDLVRSVNYCDLYLYADDCSLFLPVGQNISSAESTRRLQSDLDGLLRWSNIWKLEFKHSKCREVIFSSPYIKEQRFDPVSLENLEILRVTRHKHLGLNLDSHLAFRDHIISVIVKCNKLLNPLNSLKYTIRSKHLERIYFSFILPHLEYCSIILDSANADLLSKLEQIHYRAALIASGCSRGTSRCKVYRCLGWMSLAERRKEKKCIFMYDVISNHVPMYVRQAVGSYINPVNDNRLRNNREFRLPCNMTRRFARSTIPSSIVEWENLPSELKTRVSRNSFKYNYRLSFNGIKSQFLTSNVELSRKEEIVLNKVKCDVFSKAQLFAHQLPNITNPHCACGSGSQTIKHLLFSCPLLHLEREVLNRNMGLLPNINITLSHLTRQDERLQFSLFLNNSIPIAEGRRALKYVTTFFYQINDLM